MNQTSAVFLGFILLLGSAFVFARPQSVEVLASQVAGAMGVEPAPLLAKNQQLTQEQAYLIQTMAVKQRLGDRQPVGFKAGLTSAVAQQKFAVDGPVAGVLLNPFLQPSKADQYAVNSDEFYRLMLEAEIGFRLNRVVSQPITGLEDLKSLIKEILLVVELPDLSFKQPKAATGLDIVANNVLANQFIVGRAVSLDQQDINALSVSIYKDGQIILNGQGADAMGDQWLALQWLINQTLASGWEINPDQVLITGALGKMIPAQPGLYQVDYNSLGKIELLVK